MESVVDEIDKANNESRNKPKFQHGSQFVAEPKRKVKNVQDYRINRLMADISDNSWDASQK